MDTQPGQLMRMEGRISNSGICSCPVQAAALEIFRNSLIPIHQETNLLQVPTSQLMAPSTIERQLQMANPLAKLLSNSPFAVHQQSPSPGPLRPATLWRRSRSESDVTRAEASTAGTTSTTAPTATSSTSTLMAVPINDATCVCEHCGQGFAVSLVALRCSLIIPVNYLDA